MCPRAGPPASPGSTTTADSGLAIAEDDDDDGERSVDWAETHPREVVRENADPDDRPAESSAIHEIPGT